jgi:ABC-2 type transport system ATP-binding protein
VARLLAAEAPAAGTARRVPQRNDSPVMIRVSEATKRYGQTLAVDRVSFEVRSGEIVGFLGPNGAGKSTVLRMLSTWVPATTGRVEVAGHDVGTGALAVRRAVGYLPENNALYEGMRVDRFLRFMGAIRGMKGARLRERMEWAIEKCALHEVFDKRIDQCSKGNRQRIGLAAALLHDPRVILLDEPTHGLDPVQVVAFRVFLRELRERRAILFSSHVLAEVASVCDRLLVINHGRLLLDAPVGELSERALRQGASLEQTILDVVRAGDER